MQRVKQLHVDFCISSLSFLSVSDLITNILLYSATQKCGYIRKVNLNYSTPNFLSESKKAAEERQQSSTPWTQTVLI